MAFGSFTSGTVAQQKPNTSTSPNNPFNLPPSPSGGQSGYPGLNDAMNGVFKQYGPDIQNALTQYGRLQELQPIYDQRFGSQQQDLRAKYGFDMADKQLDRASLGIDQAAAGRDVDYYNRLLGQMGQYRGLSQQDLNNTVARARAQAATQTRNINSDYTSRGAWTAPYRGAELSDVEKERLSAEEAANIGYQRDLLGLNEKQWGLERSRDSSTDDQSKLSLAAQRLGIDEQRLQQSLDQGLAMLGYDNFISTTDLVNRIDSSKMDMANLARTIFAEAYAAGKKYLDGGIGNAYQNLGGG